MTRCDEASDVNTAVRGGLVVVAVVVIIVVDAVKSISYTRYLLVIYSRHSITSSRRGIK